MNIYVNLVPKKKLIKKIIILTFFSILCFFIKDNVFAAQLDSLRESYNNTMMTSCTDLTNDGVCSTLDSEDNPITGKTFRDILDQIELIAPYFLDMKGYDITDGEITEEQNYIYLFSTPPKIDYKHIERSFVSNETWFYYYDDIYYFTNTVNNSASCYIFKYNESTVDTYGTMNMYYSSNCLTDTDTYGDNGNDLTSKYVYRPFNSYNFCDSNFENCTLTHTFLVKVSNFDLYDLNDNLVQDGTVKDDIEVPEETIKDQLTATNGIWDVVKNIFNAIIDLPKTIIDGISSWFEWLLDGIKSLFIPGDELEGFFEEEYEYLKEQLGFLVYPIEVVVDFANRFYELDNSTSAVFKIPKLEVFEHTLYEGTSFDLMTLVNNNESMKNLYNLYRIAVSGFIVLWLVQLAVKKEHEIFGGGN